MEVLFPVSAPTKPEGRSWTEDYPDLGTDPVPVEPCISPEHFELERDRVFRPVWLNVCREQEIPAAGNYVVKDIAVCGVSVIVVRGKDGVIRAFHNVCRHRGNKLAWPTGEDGASTCRAFTCKFHGWTFQLDGRLTGVPDEAAFFDFDKSEHGLLPVTVDTWQGFVFIHLDPQPPQTLREYLGGLGEHLDGYPFADFPVCDSYQLEAKVNWKVAVDAFQEFYHVAFVHQRSVGDAVKGPDNPFSHPLMMKLHGYHRTFSGYANPAYQPRPIEVAAFKAGMSIADFSKAGMMQLPPGVNPTKSATWSFDVNVVFPNFFVDVFASSYFTYHFWPLAVDRTIIEARLYTAAATTAAARFVREQSKITLRDSVLEDYGSLEGTQEALNTGVLTHFIFQDNELLLRHNHHVVNNLTRQP